MHLKMVGIFMPAIFKCMEVADTFIPTAGAVGLLPMVTYFFLLVAMFTCLGTFIGMLAVYTTITPDQVPQKYRIASVLALISAAITGLAYYLIQGYYHDMLVDLATVSDLNDRRTLLRESYNAIGQYRYIAWFITNPLLLCQVIFRLRIRLSDNRRQWTALLMATLFMVFASYIGHQQLSFDNEIQAGAKLIWGLIALIGYSFILFTFNRLGKEFGNKVPSAFRLIVRTVVAIWGVYFMGYFLTVVDIDFNWIHIAFTITDMIGITGAGIMAYVAHTNR